METFKSILTKECLEMVLQSMQEFKAQGIEKIEKELNEFIKRNRKIDWEAEFENDEYCIGENKVKEFFYSPAELINIYVGNKNEESFMNRLLENKKL